MQHTLSVTETNKYIKELIQKDLVLSSIWVKGEISNYKPHYSGHMYFTLKDEQSLLRCVMFRSQAAFLKFGLANGMKVIVRGNISVFERDGQYQLYAEEMQPDGIGDLHLAFEQLKKKLAGEGLFDQSHKKAIPGLPRSIGVVTSRTGAVIRDIIRIVERRFPNVAIKIYPVAVQGEQAAPQMAKALKRLNLLQCVDVIILARGGGSLEELWPFNEEIVARSIYESVIPVISAVGHETDFTIADFTADLRAPTPSAAAEMAVPVKVDLAFHIRTLRRRLDTALTNAIRQRRAFYDRLMASSAFKQPYDRVYQERLRLELIDRSMQRALRLKLERSRSALSLLAGRLDALSPLSILSRGYGLVRSHGTGELIRTIEQLAAGASVDIRLQDGTAECTVDKVIIGGNASGGQK